MIPQNKIEEAYSKFDTGSWQCPISFKAGVEFAEKELSKLAIEFANWISKYQYEQNFDTKTWKYWDNGIAEYTTKELFKEFLKEYYENT